MTPRRRKAGAHTGRRSRQAVHHAGARAHFGEAQADGRAVDLRDQADGIGRSRLVLHRHLSINVRDGAVRIGARGGMQRLHHAVCGGLILEKHIANSMTGLLFQYAETLHS